MEMEGRLPVQPRTMMVNLIGHCSICLRKIKRMMTSTGDTGPTTTTPNHANGGGEEEDKHNQEAYLEEKEEGPVPEGKLPEELTSFRHIWAYLVGKGKMEEVARAKFVCSRYAEDDYGPGGMPLVVTELPPICEACGEKVTQLDRLHRELEAKVEEIKKVIKDAGGAGTHCWRRQGFGELLRNSKLEAGTILDTVHFLGLLYGVVSGVETEEPCLGTFDSPKSQPLNDEDEDIPSGYTELEGDDWKLKAAPVVSIAPVSLPIILPEVETEEGNPTREVKRRRGPVRKANVPFLPQEELVDYNWDHILDQQDIKEEVVEPVDVNNDDGDPEMNLPPTHLLLDPTDGDVDFSPDHHHVKDDNPSKEGVGGIKTEMDAASPSPRRSKRRKPSGIGKYVKPLKRKAVAQLPKPAKSDAELQAKPGMKRSWNQTPCEICNAAMSAPQMYEHMQTHIGDFVLRCPNQKCPYAYSNPRTMDQIHLNRKKKCKAAAKKAGHVCETCGIRYENAITLRAHLLLHETASKNVTCPISGCEERFTVRQSVYDHIYRMHLSPKTSQQCGLCNKFHDVKAMEAHLKGQHEIQDPIKCRECLYIFPDWESLLFHLKIKHGAGSEGIPCYICTTGVPFPNIGRLHRHYFKEHQIGKQFICDLCGKEYLSLHGLQEHIRARHDEGYRPKLNTFKCDLCAEGVNNSEYRTEKELVSHKIRVHGREPFACDVCKATFHTRQDLNWHVRDRDPEAAQRGICTKPGKREWSCDIENCSVSYYSKQSLNFHKRRDHGIVNPREKPKICEICSKEFLRAQSLLKHRQEVHMKIRKQVMCEICGEHFVSAYNLGKHKLIHTGERPHTCPICGQTFRQKEVMEVHLKSHETLGDKFKPKGSIERKKRFKRDPNP